MAYAELDAIERNSRVNNYHRSLELDETMDTGVKISNAFEYGLPAAIVSGVVGMYNTGVAFGNMLGGDFEAANASTTLEDWGWEQTADYYDEHRDTIDAVGFGLTAIVPGVVGFKAAHLAQKGLQSAGTGTIVTGLRKALVPEAKGSQYVKAVFDEEASMSRFTLGMKAAQQGFHQNFVEAAFAETAILLASAKNPSISKQDATYGEAVLDNLGGLAFGIALGGGIGGVVSSIGLHSTLKRTLGDELYKTNMESQGQIFNESGFPVGSNTGDNISMQWHQLDAVKENKRKATESNGEGITKAALTQIDNTIKKQQEDITNNIAKLTGEVDKKGRTLENSPLTGSIITALTDADVDAHTVTSIFANMTKLGRHSDYDRLFDPTISPLEVLDDASYNARYLELSPNSDPTTSAGVQFNNMDFYGTGDARERATAILVRESLLKSGLGTPDEIMFVMRHEFGHDNANRVESAFFSPAATKIREQAEAISKQVRGAAWSKWETQLKNSTKSLAKANKAGEDAIAYIHARRIAEAEKELAYYQSPRELLADSWAAFNKSDAEMIRLKREAPDLYKVLKNNLAIKRMIGETESAIDLKTFDQYMVPDRNPTVADLGAVTFNSKDGTVRYANGVVHTNFTGNTTPKSKTFNVLEVTDPEEASAYYYAADNTTNIPAPNSVIPWTDFPSLHSVKKNAEAGKIKHSQSVEMPDGTIREFHFGGNELLGTTAQQGIEEFNTTFLNLKKEAIAKIRNKRPNEEQRPNSLTPSELARITDTHEQFVEYGGVAQKENHGSSIGFWSSEYDTRKPTMVRAKYSVKSELANKNTAESISTLQQRHRANITSAHKSVVAYTAVIDKVISEGMPLPSAMSNTNVAQEVTEITAVKGVLSSVGGEYGKFESFMQGVANFNENFKKKFYGSIDDTVGSAALMLKNDRAALEEAAVLDSVLRRDFYKFADVDSTDIDVAIPNFLARYASKPEYEERIPLILDAVRNNMKTSANEGTMIWSRDLESAMASAMSSKNFGDSQLSRIASLSTTGIQTIKNKNLTAFWKAKVKANNSIVEGKKTIAGIRGMSSSLESSVLYPGAFDTARYQGNYKYVRATVKGLFSDDRMSIIAASTKEGLEAKERQLLNLFGDKVQLLTKDEIAKDKGLWGKYEKDLDFDGDTIDSMMKRKGVMSDLIPDVSPDLIDHYIADMKGQAKGVVDNLTSAAYSDEFAALEFQSQRLQLRDTTGGKKPLKDPNKEAMNVMLNNSSGEKSFWRTTQQDADKLFSTAYNTTKGLMRRAKTKQDFSQVAKYMQSAGLPATYTPDVAKYLHENAKVSDQVLSEVIPASNGAIATMMLRMDYIQPIVTAMSTPITALPELAHLIKSIPDLAKQQAVKNSLRTGIPRTEEELAAGAKQHGMFSNTKLMFQAAKDYWQKPELVEKYTELGLTPSIVQEMREQAARIALDPALLKEAGGKEKYLGMVTKAVNVLSTPADKTEGFVKFVAARTADLALEAAGITDDAIRVTAMNTYVKRVHGNYSYAQRPQMFQGFAGQAIGLFQTYQFNMIQQMFRHIGDKEVSNAMAMVGLQAGIFGTQSLPGFQAMNQHIGERSKEGRDFYTGAADILGNDASEWLLYGAGSNFTKPMHSAINYMTGMDTQAQGIALFTRGDMTPRTPILLPTSIEDMPVVNLTTKFINNVLDSADALTDGVGVSQVFADALAQNGVNRPLSGIGQMLGGAKVTSKGGLIAAQQDLDWWQGLTKLAGTSTLDEAIATQHYYRAKGYDTYRREQINGLGVRTKEMMRAGQWDDRTYRDMFQKYADLGGKADYFSRWAHDQYMGATNSQITQMRNVHDSPSGKYLQRLMGANISPNVETTFIQGRSTFSITNPDETE